MLILQTHNIHNLPNILNNAIEKQKLEVEVLSCEGDIIENIPVKRDSKYKAWVNIMYGCDKFCTYCIVPYTRGKQRSRRKEFILEEVENAENSLTEAKEVMTNLLKQVKEIPTRKPKFWSPSTL